MELSDGGARIAAGTGCAATSTGGAVCTVPYVHLTVALEDGDDSASLAVSATAEGGPGDDLLSAATAPATTGSTLLGGQGADTVVGSAGRDQLDGGAGPDRIEGRGDEDVIKDGDAGSPPAADTIDGGSGRDHLDFSDVDRPVRVNLPLGLGGAAGEDRLFGLEDVTGGDGDDVLVGAADANRLLGLGGDDRLTGDGGDDRLEGSTGDDRLAGGPGDDELAGEEGVDALDGGRGDDVLSGRFARGESLGLSVRDGRGGRDATRDLLSHCETVLAYGGLRASAPRSSRGGVMLRIGCAKSFPSTRRCSGSVSLRADGASLGGGRFRVTPGSPRTVSIGLDAAGREALRGARRLTVAIRYAQVSVDLDPPVDRFRFGWSIPAREARDA